MSENGSKDISITRDMVIDKIDAEHEAINRDMQDDTDPGLLASAGGHGLSAGRFIRAAHSR